TVAQCNQEKLCKFNLSTQTPSNCPCLNTGDPRAGQTCPAYCVKGYATATCTCDTNATNYTVSQCQQEKLCITNLVNQTVATRFILENCTFQNIDISYSSGQGAYSAVLNGVNQTVVINKSTFRNCSNQLSATGAGAIFISFSNASVVSNEINITNSRFLYNAGYNTGAIFSERVTNKVNLTNNQFIGNSQIAVASGKGRDAQLAWPKYSSVQTADAAKQKVQQLFNGGTSTIRNSIHYLFVVNDKDDVNGFIDLNVTQELCQSKTEMTADCMCDPDSTTYPVAQCQKDKLCITDLSHQTPSNCPCLPTNDPRSGQTCPAYCVKGNVT
ncbi:MAG: hypothetical protein EZS28_051226, partial [Streblomastix strix]